MNIHSLQVVVWLTTLWIAECVANSVPVFVQKGANLTLTCDAPPSRWSWREHLPNHTTNRLNVTTANYTVLNVSEEKLHYGYGCEATANSKVYEIYPINAINKPVISSQGNGLYVCSANGTGFGQLLLNWTVNSRVIPGNATTNDAFTSAQSKLMVDDTTQMMISCTAYYSTNKTNSSTSNFDKVMLHHNKPHGRAAAPPRKRFAPLKDALLFFAALSLAVERVGGVVRMALVVASPHASYGRVTLRCVCDSTLCSGGKVTWQRRVSDSSQELRWRQQPADLAEVAIVLTPQLEGMYSCVFNSSRSNEVELIANLVPDPAVNKMSYYQVYAGSNITLPCVFTPGAMATSYRLDWHKELTPIYGSQAISPLPGRYTVSQSFALTINNAEVSDSALYQCSVTVNTTSSIIPVTTYAPVFKLDVIAPLSIIQAPITVTFTRAKTTAAVFSCVVSGSPKPRLIWFHQRVQVHGSKYTITDSTITSSQTYLVTSTLTIGMVEANDSGPVMCMAVVAETQQVLTGSADLIAISCVSDVQLQVLQDGGVQIRIAMAAVIPGPFGLTLSYTPAPPSQSFGSYVTQVTDLSFADVGEVTYKIPQQKLPTLFNSFSVKVALLARGVQGDPSNDSNIVTLASSGTSPTSNTAALSGLDCPCDNTPLIVAAILFVVELLVITGAVVVAAVVVVVWRRRNKETSIELEYRDSSLDDHHKHTLGGNTKASHTTLDSGELAKMEDQTVRSSGGCRTLPGKGTRRDKDQGTGGDKSLPHSRSVEDVSLHQPHLPAEGFVYSTLQRDGTGGRSNVGSVASPTSLSSPPPYVYNTTYRTKVLGISNPLQYPTTDV